MASTKIQNLPIKSPIGSMKIPTGGFGDYSITVNSIGEFIIDTFNLATTNYVDNIVADKEDRILTTGGNLLPVSQLSEIPDTNNDIIDEVAQALLNRIEYVKDNFSTAPSHNELLGRSASGAHPSTSISHKSGTVYTYLQNNETDINQIKNTDIPNLNINLSNKQDIISIGDALSSTPNLSQVPSVSHTGINTALQALLNRNTYFSNHNNLTNKSDENSHPASAIQDETGFSQQEINNSIKLKTFDDLKNFKPIMNGQTVYVGQRSNTYLQGGGLFYADTSDTTSLDNDGTILVGIDGTRWKRKWNTYADPCWFGADYTGTDDCSAQVQKAVDVSYGRVWFGNADRSFKMMTPVGLPTNSIVGDMLMEICGDGARVWVYSNTGIFTSKRSIGLETSTDDLYTAALEIGRGLRFQGDGTSQSVVVNGDRLYNVNMKGGRYLRISALVRATQPRRNETTGYVQSVTIESNHLALCNRIIDSKRGFNVTVSRNFGESCYGGVYLDGDGSPAVNVIRCDGNLWESSGVFAKLGAIYAGTFIGNYFEGNNSGDLPTLKCLIELGKTGTTGYSSGVTFIGNQFGAANAYKTDVDYADVKFTSSLSGTSLDILAPPTFVGNWTNAYRMWTAGQVVTQFGNAFSGGNARRHQAPKLHTEARVTFDLSRKEFLSSTNLVGGVHTIAEVDTNLISNLVNQSARACTADMNIFMQMKNSSNVVLGAAVAKVSLVVQGSEGIGTGATTDVYVAASLTGFTQLEGGVIDTVNNVSLFKHFTSPVLTIERVGTKYLLKLSGYVAASGSLYGATAKVFSNTTMTIYSLNSGASLAGQIYPT
ncbi:tailspike protein [Acinetobacter phage BS46]|nr:tailspike protein [Acinetobacter phage BS46]